MDKLSLVSLANRYASTEVLVRHLTVHYPNRVIENKTGCSRIDLITTLANNPDHKEVVCECLSYCSNYELIQVICSEVVVDWFAERYRSCESSIKEFFNACDSFNKCQLTDTYVFPSNKYILSYIGKVITLDNEREIHDSMSCHHRSREKMLAMYGSKELFDYAGIALDEYTLENMLVYSMKVSEERLLTVVGYILPLTGKLYNTPATTFSGIIDFYNLFIVTESKRQKFHSECFSVLRVLRREYGITDNDLTDEARNALSRLYEEQV